ncbi:hypothetical protein FGG08_000056 [Glutinoglossum americanum]|uniref:t-SNARE affecting a late Golgi compartment protein 1 n=1 Tax=Glutinoglossum americanum TaxID=1670608 RepID=A0A9P8IDQ1_9PEZI|nr:hypothetical protein FGG08_000056 [Glutinoglossum americanum]
MMSSNEEDPFLQVQADVLSLLNTTRSLFASYLRIRSLASSPTSPELVQSRSELETTLQDLSSDLRDLIESVKAIEHDPYRYGIEIDEVERRQRLVEEVGGEVEDMHEELAKAVAGADQRRGQNASGSGALPHPSAFDDLENQGDDYAAFEQQRQLEIMHEQEEALDGVFQTVGNLRQQADVMGRELEEQEELLNETHDAADRVEGRLQVGLKKMGVIMKKNEGTPVQVLNDIGASSFNSSQLELLIHRIKELSITNMAEQHEASGVSYEELAELEKEFDDAELEIIRAQTLLNAPLYIKRNAMISRLPNFWPLVLEQAPPEIDQFIQPSDSAVLVSALKDIDVSRFEIPPAASPEVSGSPRSVAIKFEFGPNEWFEDRVLEKKFWYRRAKDGWTGLVSEPVKINWKEGKDLSCGLTDAAVAAFEAEARGARAAAVVAANGNKQKGKATAEKKTPEQEALENLAAGSTQGSLFAWFGFRGRRVTAEESVEAVKEEDERRAKLRKGEKASSDINMRPIDGDEQDSMEEDLEEDDADLIFPAGEELAIAISEDLFPGALKYFTQAQEQADLTDTDYEELDSDDDDETGDLNELLQGGKRGIGGDDEGPKKKRKA